MQDPYVQGMFGLFIAMLVGLLLFHRHKLWVVGIGFAVLTAVFMWNMGGWDVWVDHFREKHRSHLLINLALLLPAFALVAYYFERSGASLGLARVLQSDVALLWSIFWMSTILDNIAAALIGGMILLAKYGKTNIPFKMIVGVIGAANLGGAGSPVGDTTTVMMFISEDPIISVMEIMKGFIASFPAQLLLSIWAKNHGHLPQASLQEGRGGAVREKIEERDVIATAAASDGPEVEGLMDASETKVQWSMMWPMLAIPGLILGNLKDQPGLGLWAGLLLGLLFAAQRINRKVFFEALPNTLFLLLLIAAAELLPLEQIKPNINRLPRNVVAILAGLLSAWFDNIPLTAICLNLGGFDWGLLAYCVGYGGTAMWFGSSAGVAIGLIFPEVYNTKRWGVPFVVVTLTYLVGVACYLVTFKLLLKGDIP